MGVDGRNVWDLNPTSPMRIRRRLMTLQNESDRRRLSSGFSCMTARLCIGQLLLVASASLALAIETQFGTQHV